MITDPTMQGRHGPTGHSSYMSITTLIPNAATPEASASGTPLGDGTVSTGAHALAVPTYWEKAAATRWGSYLTEIEKRAILRADSLALASSTIYRRQSALEIGCEGGRWSILLSDLGWQMTCVDVDRRVLDECQRKVPTARCVLSRPVDETIPCDSGSMALLLCIEVGEVMETDWFLAEAHRVLDHGGVFVGVCWNRRSWRGIACRTKYFLTNDRDGRYYYKQSYSGWKRKLVETGFRLMHEEGCCWGPFGRSSNSPLIPPFTRWERLCGLHRLTALSPWVVFIACKK